MTVEDEPDIRGLIANELSEDGSRVIQVLNREQGLSTVRRFRPKVIIVDLIMPKMSGLQSLPRLDPEITADISVIATSGLTEPSIA